MNLLYFKLSNGDDIMANMIEDHDDHFIIEWPYKFLYQVTPFSNVLATSVIRWVPMKEVMVAPMKIYKATIVTYAKMPEILELYYGRVRERTLQEFSSEEEEIIEEDPKQSEYEMEMDDNFAEELEQAYNESKLGNKTTIH